MCEKFISDANVFKGHLRVHTLSHPYSCKQRSKILKSADEMGKHVFQEHSEDKPYHCEICDVRFAWFSDLKNHTSQHIHNVDCKDCKKKFSQVYIMKHEQLNKKLREENSLNANELPFTKIAVNGCNHCNKTFYELAELRQHVVSEHVMEYVAQPDYHCVTCRAQFKGRTSTGGNRSLLLPVGARKNPILGNAHYQVFQCNTDFNCPVLSFGN